MAGLDPNVWYQMTETRVDFNSSLQTAGDALVMAKAGPTTNQYWQIFPVSDGNYQVRNQASGVNKQLATCYNPQEIDPSQTQPCMQPASGDQSQLWIVDTWGDGTYRFVNVGNGSGYNMDCHPGDPMFMSSTTAVTPNQPAQHWEFSSLSEINDGAYSTTITEILSSTSSTTPATAAASTTSSAGKVATATTTSQAIPEPSLTDSAAPFNGLSTHKKSGISTGAAVGTGIAVGLAVCLFAALFLIFCQRRKRNGSAGRRPRHELMGEGVGNDDKKDPIVAQEMYVPPSELSDQNFHMYELDQPTTPRANHKPGNSESYT